MEMVLSNNALTSSGKTLGQSRRAVNVKDTGRSNMKSVGYYDPDDTLNDFDGFIPDVEYELVAEEDLEFAIGGGIKFKAGEIKKATGILAEKLIVVSDGLIHLRNEKSEMAKSMNEKVKAMEEQLSKLSKKEDVEKESPVEKEPSKPKGRPKKDSSE